MRFSLINTLVACAFCISMAACGGSSATITDAVGRVQLGMTVDEVSRVLGSGQIIEPARSEGAHTMEVVQYPASEGRVYVVRYIDGLVRRWEILAR